MFKNAATKIAHNSTLPSIGGNKDLRPLQDLITAEKSVLASLQKLSLDFAKASDALRGWGMGEGDDLGDTLSASTTILAHFSSALAQYASREQSVREHMKAIRTREEGLDELKRRRKSIAAKADSAERKLNKMGPEHKNLAMQTDILHRLRDEIRQLDTEIMTEEARLGDFKRSTTRSLMGLKFGGLQELSAKGAIVGDFGKQIIAEIPEDVTQPGLPRNFYNGHGKTEYCMEETQRYVSEVVFSGVTGQADPSSSRLAEFPAGGTMMPTGSMNQGVSPSGSTSYLPAPQFEGHNINNPQTGMYELAQPSSPQVFATSSQNQTHSQERSVDEFGVGSMSSGPLSPRLGVGPGGGKFATFPVKASNRPSINLRDNASPSLSIRPTRAPSLSFSSQVEQALNSPVNTSFSPPKSGGTGFDDPVPVYEAVPSPTFDPPPGPPPGATAHVFPPDALPSMINPWNIDHEADGNHREPQAPPRASADEADDIHLAYMSSAYDVSERPPDRRVRFGAVSDVDEEMEARRRQSQDDITLEIEDQTTVTSREGPDDVRTPTATNPVPTPSPPSDPRPRRVPAPAIDDLADESSLNAAAAREVSREMDSLTFSPPPIDRAHSPLMPPAPPFAQSPAVARVNINTDSLPVEPVRGSVSPTSPGGPASPLQQNSIPPPQLSLPDRSVSSLSQTTTGSPYRTPMESPVRTPTESPYRPPTLSNLSQGVGPTNTSSSLTSPPLPPGTRTISAAAFKRPSPRMSTDASGPADTTPLAFKKRTLPSSPYPPRLQQSPREPSGSSLRGGPAYPPAPPPKPAPAPPRSMPSSPVDAVHRRVPSSVPQNTFPDEDDQFDYITAYVNNMGTDEENESPIQEDYGKLGQTKIANGGGSNPTSPGYGQGRFATNLEDGGLR